MTFSSLVVALAQVLTLVVIARAVLSWFSGVRLVAPLTALLETVTQPLVGPIRRRLPPMAGFDLSPLIVVLLIGVVESLVLGALAGR